MAAPLLSGGVIYANESGEKYVVVRFSDQAPPSLETVRGGTYRPLSRPLFIYVNAAALARAEVARFVQFYVDEGSPLIEEVGYVPLAAAELDLVKQRHAAKTTGTMFDAASATQAQITLEQRLRGQR